MQAAPTAVIFRHDFRLSIPSQSQPVKAAADLAVPEVHRVSAFLPGAAGLSGVVTVGPRTDIARRALREVRGRQAGATRRRDFEHAELALVLSF